jgi:hypothetical protein
MKKMWFVFIIVTILFASCTVSQQREFKTLQSNWSGGLDRILVVYNLDGSVHAKYEGKIDVQYSDGGKVLFDFEGKRYIYYNFPTEVIEK